jgi:hypothetical protein
MALQRRTPNKREGLGETIAEAFLFTPGSNDEYN